MVGNELCISGVCSTNQLFFVKPFVFESRSIRQKVNFLNEQKKTFVVLLRAERAKPCIFLKDLGFLPSPV